MGLTSKHRLWVFLYRWRMDNGLERCRLCGTYDDLTFEHLMPKALGGSNDITNISITCYRCNNGRPLEFLKGVQHLATDAPGTKYIPSAFITVGDLTSYGVVADIRPYGSKFAPTKRTFIFDKSTAIRIKTRPAHYVPSDPITLLVGDEYATLRDHGH